MSFVSFQFKYAGLVRRALVFMMLVLFAVTPNAHAFVGLNITSPLAGSLNTGGSVITFTSDSDSTPLEAECSIDNFVTFAACTTGVTTLADIPGFSAHAQGTFTFSVRDAFGRDTITASVTGAVKDTMAPVITTSAPNNGSLVGSSHSVGFTLSESVSSGAITMARTGGAADRSDHVYLLVRGDGDAGSHTVSFSTLQQGFGNTLVDEATYTMTFTATDTAGNVASPVVITGVTYDGIPPADPGRLHIFSNNGSPTLAKIGDTVTVTAVVDEGTRISGTIGGKPVTVSEVVGTVGTLSRVLDGTESEAVAVDFTIYSSDGANNLSAVKTNASILDDSHVQTDFTPPASVVASPGAGSFSSTQNVTLTSSGATVILYTLDGTSPTCSVGTAYTGPISISATKTVKAKACDAAGNASSVATFTYTMSSAGGGGGSGGGGGGTVIVPYSPTASPSAGIYTGTQTISLASTGSTSIRYSIDGSTPTCTTGTVYTGPITVSSTKTIKVKGCSSAGSSPLGTFLFTIKAATTSSGTTGSTGSTGSGTATVLPAKPVSNLPSTPVTNSNSTPTATPTANQAESNVSLMHDPALYQKLLSDFGLKSDGVNFTNNKTILESDIKEFGVSGSPEQIRVMSNFVTYGASTETIKLGMGERHAVVRDYLETVGRADVVWDDVQRMTIGQKPLKRNLAKEQAQAATALAAFTKMVGHAPNFKDAKEDLAWNTLMYRIRFPRDLAKEKWGIVRFQTIFKRAPVTPLEWAEVRALGYVLP